MNEWIESIYSTAGTLALLFILLPTLLLALFLALLLAVCSIIPSCMRKVCLEQS
jgi:hypothetical protein